MYYTLGQRKGLGIGGIQNHATGSWFVVGKDIEKKELYVVQGDDSEWLYHDRVFVKDVNWVGKEKPTIWTKFGAKFRYRQPDVDVLVRFVNDTELEVKCFEKVRAITPGQMAVFYDGDVCLGGGTIEEIL